MTDIGNITPKSTENVQFKTAPTDANGVATTPTLTWSVSPPVGMLTVSPDTPMLFVTPDVDFRVVVTVQSPRGWDQAESPRANVTTVIGLSASRPPSSTPPGDRCLATW
jgi:hypothetical protein